MRLLQHSVGTLIDVFKGWDVTQSLLPGDIVQHIGGTGKIIGLVVCKKDGVATVIWSHDFCVRCGEGVLTCWCGGRT